MPFRCQSGSNYNSWPVYETWLNASKLPRLDSMHFKLNGVRRNWA